MKSSRALSALLVVPIAALPVWLLANGPSRGEVQHAVDQAGLLAPAVFVAIYIAWTVLLLPGVVPTLAGGALFGVAGGSALALIGAVTGATVAFLIGRRAGRERVRRLAGRRGERLECWLGAHGFVALLYARLVPVVPFNLLNYAAGVTGMRTRPYVIATAVGIVPGTVAYAALGNAAARPGSTPFVVSVVAVAMLTLTVTLLGRRGRRPVSGP